eukprot:772926-Pyramimonas_sp.AAC.1
MRNIRLFTPCTPCARRPAPFACAAIWLTGRADASLAGVRAFMMGALHRCTRDSAVLCIPRNTPDRVRNAKDSLARHGRPRWQTLSFRVLEF